MEWNTEFYKDSKGREPVRDFLMQLDATTRAKVTRYFKLLLIYGVLLKEPYTKRVKGKIREIIVIGKDGHLRILYFTYTGKLFVLLHGFIKKTKKTPPADIKIAEARMEDFLKRCI